MQKSHIASVILQYSISFIYYRFNVCMSDFSTESYPLLLTGISSRKKKMLFKMEGQKNRIKSNVLEIGVIKKNVIHNEWS